MSNNSIFISYRREASKYLAPAIYQYLKEQCGINVFLDIESLGTGQFGPRIFQEIESRPYFLLILTPDTLTRCIEPSDWLLREIDHAKKTEREFILLFTPDFNFIEIDRSLSGSLASYLRSINGLKVVHSELESSMQKLCAQFLRPIEGTTRVLSTNNSELDKQNLFIPSVTETDLLAQSHFEHGKMLYLKNDWKDAIVEFDKAISINSNYDDAYEARGAAKHCILDFKGAIQDYDKAISLNPSNFIACNNRGVSKQSISNWAESLHDLNEAIRLNPYYASAYNNRGMVWLKRTRYKEAIEDFSQAISLYPKFGKAFSNRAIAYYRLGEFKSALDNINTAIQLNPEFYKAYYNRCEILLRQGKLREAYEDWKTGTRIQKQNGR